MGCSTTCWLFSTILLVVFGAIRYQIYLNDLNTKCIPSSQINDPNYNEGGHLYIPRIQNRSVFGENLETRPFPSNPFEVSTGVGQAVTIYGKLLDSESCEPIKNTRIEIWQGCLNNSEFVSMDIRDRPHVYLNEKDDCHGSVWSDENGNYQFDARIPVAYMNHYPHWHYQVHPNYPPKSEMFKNKNIKIRKLMGSIYLRFLYPSQSLWLNACKMIFGTQCRVLGFHEWRKFGDELEDAFGPEFWLFNTAVDYGKKDAWFNDKTQRLMIEYDIVGDYFYEPAPFYALLFRPKWPFFEFVKDIEYVYGY